MMTFGSLFAGIGGFDLALERLGMTCKWQVEIDPFCKKVLTKHWPNVQRFSDVRECGRHNLEPVDLICGGVPCQPASCAGKRRGTADDRWLWPEAIRIVRELHPRWCLFENVPGLLSLEQGVVFNALLSDMEVEGYEVATIVVPACAFNAPHKRSRVWIVAHAKNLFSNGSINYARVSVEREQIPKLGDCGRKADVAHPYDNQQNKREGEVSTTNQWTLARGSEFRSGGCSADVAYSQFARPQEREGKRDNNDSQQQATERDGDVEDANCIRLEEHRMLQPSLPERPSETRTGDESRQGDVADTESTGEVKVLCARGRQQKQLGGVSWREDRGRFPQSNLGESADGLSNRLVRPWGPGWEDGVPRVAIDVPDRVNKLRALGNAVVPQVVEWIGQRIIDADNLYYANHPSAY